jgi:hypothetical protein
VAGASNARGRAGGVCRAGNSHFDIYRLGRTIQKGKFSSLNDEGKGIEILRGWFGGCCGVVVPENMSYPRSDWTRIEIAQGTGRTSE